jgi:dTDP-4-dehydrorhamnose reductase
LTDAHAEAPHALITGIGGFLGSNLAAHLQQHGWSVYGGYHSKASGLKGVQERPLDVCLPAAISEAVAWAQPTAVFHLAAMADPDACAADPPATRQINVQGAKLMAAAAAQAGARFVFPSTDQVCDGSRAMADELALAKPLGVYGASKRDAEAAVFEAAPQALVVRLALTYGWGRGSAKGRNFSEKWLRTILTGGRQAAFTDQWRTPIYAEDACEALRMGADKGWTGLLNLAGPDRMNRYDFAVRLAKEFGFPEGSVQAASAKDVVFKDPRPDDSSLSTDKLRALGLQPRGVDAGLKAMHRALENL